MNSGVIRVTRLRGTHSTMVSFRSLLDGQPITSIDQGQTRDLRVAPGKHTVQIRTAWAGSREMSIEVMEDSTAELVCRANGSPVTGLFDSVFHRWDTVELAESEEALPRLVNAGKDTAIRIGIIFISPFIIGPVTIGVAYSVGLGGIAPALAVGLVMVVVVAMCIIKLPARTRRRNL